MALVIATITFLSMVVALVAVLLGERARRRRAEAEAVRLAEARKATLRLLRLATGDQRNMALALFGHAHLGVESSNRALTGLARRLLALSEDLAAQADDAESSRRLTDEEVDVLPIIEFALAQVSAQMGPTQRVWRLSPSMADARLVADRRALNQVLVNVLSGAAASSRDGDWIEVSTQQSDEGLSIVVQDEGVGLPITQDVNPAEARGIGLRLTLARSLMQAHGGALTVESAAHVGTQVRLTFPRTRVMARVAA